MTIMVLIVCIWIFIHLCFLSSLLFIFNTYTYCFVAFRAFEEVARQNEIEIVVSTFFSVSDMNMDLAFKTLKDGKARVIVATVHTFACSSMLRNIMYVF